MHLCWKVAISSLCNILTETHVGDGYESATLLHRQFSFIARGYLPFLSSYKHTSTHAGSVPRFSLDLVGSIKHFKDTEIISPIEGCKPNGHGLELVASVVSVESWARFLISKTHRAEELVHVKSVMIQSSHFGVVQNSAPQPYYRYGPVNV
ncbi:hypothetical protein TNCV_1489581 [Trichonephila clavipes]|nr:hypothetical protein TNCV_1489581 [Trichonephila clavipes]